VSSWDSAEPIVSHLSAPQPEVSYLSLRGKRGADFHSVYVWHLRSLATCRDAGEHSAKWPLLIMETVCRLG
jgi:hypothetical protein